MANTDSARKRIRQTEKRTARNKARKSRVRTYVRKLEEAIATGDKAAELNFSGIRHNNIHPLAQVGRDLTTDTDQGIARSGCLNYRCICRAVLDNAISSNSRSSRKGFNQSRICH